jgi:hypothetical protein
MHRRILFLTAVLTLGGCSNDDGDGDGRRDGFLGGSAGGKESSNPDNEQPRDRTAGPATGEGGEATVYYGYVGRCLQSVKRSVDSRGEKLTWTPLCSPIFADGDLAAVKAELKHWYEANCKSPVTYPMPADDSRHCWIVPGEFDTTAFPKSKVEAMRLEPGECRALEDRDNLTLRAMTTEYGWARCGSP